MLEVEASENPDHKVQSVCKDESLGETVYRA